MLAHGLQNPFQNSHKNRPFFQTKQVSEELHSHFDNEMIAVAEFNGEKAGVGRLVKVDENNLELGGMYVFEPFRGKGIAKKIVNFLLAHVGPS